MPDETEARYALPRVGIGVDVHAYGSAARCGWPGSSGPTRTGWPATPTATWPRTRPATRCWARPGSAISARSSAPTGRSGRRAGFGVARRDRPAGPRRASGSGTWRAGDRQPPAPREPPGRGRARAVRRGRRPGDGGRAPRPTASASPAAARASPRSPPPWSSRNLSSRRADGHATFAVLRRDQLSAYRTHLTAAHS